MKHNPKGWIIGVLALALFVSIGQAQSERPEERIQALQSEIEQKDQRIAELKKEAGSTESDSSETVAALQRERQIFIDLGSILYKYMKASDNALNGTASQKQTALRQIEDLIAEVNQKGNKPGYGLAINEFRRKAEEKYE